MNLRNFDWRNITLGALAACLLLPSYASADPIIIDTIEQNEFVTWFDSFSYTHNINDDGFVLGSAIGGTLEILLSDDGGFLDSFEALLFIVDGFNFDTGDFSFGTSFFGDLEVSALGSLNQDGLLDITVQSLWGDFYVGNSTLTVYTSISEPGIFGLLFFGLLAMGIARRRQQA